ncbi:hypothetical protein H6P81_005039 [Aristolochia fimbriata]|uniref:C2H2-type domain-containing protein n=1 Tax=Aristolochia fimbriata TaxID=158543 RepID=A0AAV7ETC3_ARIFI|nr:hypothetical protein H6P81_005039 [Aristolochia fimbriata]
MEQNISGQDEKIVGSSGPGSVGVPRSRFESMGTWWYSTTCWGNKAWSKTWKLRAGRISVASVAGRHLRFTPLSLVCICRELKNTARSMYRQREGKGEGGLSALVVHMGKSDVVQQQLAPPFYLPRCHNQSTTTSYRLLMGTEIGLIDSLTQLQKLAQEQNPNPGSSGTGASPGTWMWAARRAAAPAPPPEEDDSWEVRAFAEDTGSVMGTTWPPRSYTCTFCRREFRSAQALGGHMNVHRRDRARLRQSPPGSDASSSSSAAATATVAATGLFPPHQELGPNGGAGLCLFYPFPNHTQGLPPLAPSPSSLLSISPYYSFLPHNCSSTGVVHRLQASQGEDGGDDLYPGRDNTHKGEAEVRYSWASAPVFRGDYVFWGRSTARPPEGSDQRNQQGEEDRKWRNTEIWVGFVWFYEDEAGKSRFSHNIWCSFGNFLAKTKRAVFSPDPSWAQQQRHCGCTT